MSKLALLLLALPVTAHASPSPTTIAKCGDSTLDLTPGAEPATGTLHATIATGATRWTFTGTIALARVGAKTRTLAIEDLQSSAAAAKKAPAGLVIDLLLDDKKLLLRHASEGDPDIAYAVDLPACTFTNDAALTALVPPPTEPTGCAPAVVKTTYRKQVLRVATLPDAEAAHQAQMLCADHQKTLAARAALEAAVSDRAARDRLTARGPALLKVEDNRVKAWSRIDACLTADPTSTHGIASLYEAETHERACYAKIAARP
jgi:hypothetical protein